uniref:Uncharacterized protein n=1 Tax=Magallana gigas TaxID=29159 RepID=K1QFA7_MAGGI
MILTDWRRLPAELKPRVRRKTKSGIKPSVKVKPKVKLSVEDVSKTLEETDYILSYFDNGEEYGNDDDDADEGPVY